LAAVGVRELDIVSNWRNLGASALNRCRNRRPLRAQLIELLCGQLVLARAQPPVHRRGRAPAPRKIDGQCSGRVRALREDDSILVSLAHLSGDDGSIAIAAAIIDDL